jgi:hypothetical protein
MMTATDKTPRAKRSAPRQVKPTGTAATKARTPASNHRHRQASVAALLDQTFGRFADSSPDMWERRAYLMLVGLVYERLATNEDELPTDEIVTLAKVLAENRRAEKRVGDAKPPARRDASTSPDGALPTAFTRLVQQVYGTDLTPSDAPPQPHGTEPERARKP